VHSVQLWPTQLIFLLWPKVKPTPSASAAAPPLLMDALPHLYGAEPMRHRHLFHFPMNRCCPVVSSWSNRYLDSAPLTAAWPTVSPPHPYKTRPRLRFSTPRLPLPTFAHLCTSSALSSRNYGRHLSQLSLSHLSPSTILCQPG
jgi:hypothetical protein